MNNRVKLILYIVFLTGACVCGWKFYQTYTAASARAAAEKLDPPAVAETNAPPVTGTNAVPDPAETDPPPTPPPSPTRRPPSPPNRWTRGGITDG